MSLPFGGVVAIDFVNAMSATVQFLSAAHYTSAAAARGEKPDISFTEVISALLGQNRAPSSGMSCDGVVAKPSKADTCGLEGKGTDYGAERDDAETDTASAECTVACDTIIPTICWTVSGDTRLPTTFECKPPQSTNGILPGYSSHNTTLYPRELRVEGPSADVPDSPMVDGGTSSHMAFKSDPLPCFPDTSTPAVVSPPDPVTQATAEPLGGRSAATVTEAAITEEPNGDCPASEESGGELLLAVPPEWRERVETATVSREWTDQRTAIGRSVAESHTGWHIASGKPVDSVSGAGQVLQVSDQTRMSVLAAPHNGRSIAADSAGEKSGMMHATPQQSHGVVARYGPTDQIRVASSEGVDAAAEARGARRCDQVLRDIPEVGAQTAEIEKRTGAPKQAKAAIAVDSDVTTSHEKLTGSHPLVGAPDGHPQSTSEPREAALTDAGPPMHGVAALGGQPDVNTQDTPSSQHLGRRPDGSASVSLPDISEPQPAKVLSSLTRPDLGSAKTEVHIALRTPELGRVELRASAVDSDVKAVLTVESRELRHALVCDEAGLGSICARHEIDPSNITISTSEVRDWPGAGDSGAHRDRQNDAPAQRSLVKENVPALVEEEVLDTSTGTGLNIRA